MLIKRVVDAPLIPIHHIFYRTAKHLIREFELIIKNAPEADKVEKSNDHKIEIEIRGSWSYQTRWIEAWPDIGLQRKSRKSRAINGRFD